MNPLPVLLLLVCPVAPVEGTVVDPFRSPACTWCAGNRGITYATEPRSPVRAVLGGTVTYVGRVVDRRYVVVAAGDGRRLTYGNLATETVEVGDRVAPGHVVGTSTDTVHFGVRRGDAYEDPATVLGGRSRARLIRLDGRRRPPSASIPCGLAAARPSSTNFSRLPPAVA